MLLKFTCFSFLSQLNCQTHFVLYLQTKSLSSSIKISIDNYRKGPMEEKVRYNFLALDFVSCRLAKNCYKKLFFSRFSNSQFLKLLTCLLASWSLFYLFLFHGVLVVQKFDFSDCVRINVDWECQKAHNLDLILHPNSYFSNTTGSLSSDKVATELIVIYESYWVEKLGFLFLHWNPVGLLVGANCFLTRVSPKHLVWFPSSSSESKVPFKWWVILCKKSVFSVQWMFDDPEVSENPKTLDMLR